MRGSLYAVRTKSGWQLRVSLDLHVDLLWWLDRETHAIYLLSEGLPFGWAVEARDSFKAFSEMDRWAKREWDHFLMRTLQEEIKAEARLIHPADPLDEGALVGRHRGWLVKDGQVTAWGRMFILRGHGEDSRDLRTEKRMRDRGGEGLEEQWRGDMGGAGIEEQWREDQDGELVVLADAAQRLAAALAGRSLLEAELQQLLAERLPGLAPVWRSALQH
ncbi:hypothetical protein ACTND9_13960, partial [Paenibacillus barengoltzii]